MRAQVAGSRRFRSKSLILLLSTISALLLVRAPIVGQKTPRIGDSEIIQTLDRLNVLGSVLVIGAHPDDENNRTLAYLARGRHLRTGYLSLTRGEGGQNLLGSERYEALGLIRTQELLAARRVDGAEQYFTRAFDFGFTKSYEETLAKWGRERVLADMVRVIRRFRPDLIVTCFSPTEKTDHGMHTASAFLAPVALEAAADRKSTRLNSSHIQKSRMPSSA